MRNSFDIFFGNRTPTFNTRRAFEDLFETAFQQPFAFGDNASPSEGWFQPAIDVEESENAYLLNVDLPGVRKDDLHIDVKENVLTISGVRKNDKRQLKFSRQFSLPRSVDPEAIEANLEDGVLTIALTKSEKAKPRTIQIQSGSPSRFSQLLGLNKKEVSSTVS